MANHQLACLHQCISGAYAAFQLGGGKIFVNWIFQTYANLCINLCLRSLVKASAAPHCVFDSFQPQDALGLSFSTKL